MEHQKILNLLSEGNDSKFVTRKWDIVNDNSKANYNVGKIDGTATDDVENLDLVMLMYNLIEYSSNYSEITRSL